MASKRCVPVVNSPNTRTNFLGLPANFQDGHLEYMQSHSPLPSWTRNAVFYEVYPQTFLDTNGDGIGDLEGIIRKLDYIQSVGATALWINPFYLSPMRDAGYDVADFYQVDPRYGTLDDARRLFREIHQRGMRVILDFVPGHTSIDHPWFRQSASTHAARPFRNWYIWTDSAWDNGGTPWNQKMMHGYSNRNGNFLINFFWSQPALNFGFAQPEADKPWQLPTTHADVQALWREMRRVMRFWLEQGADGFRVDMADSLIRNDPGHREIRRFWSESRAELQADFPDLFLIAEGHPSNVLDGSGFHSAYLHWAAGYWQVFRKGDTRAQDGSVVSSVPYFDPSGNGDFRPYLATWREQYQHIVGHGVITVPVGNHDLPRIATGQSEDALEMIFAFQCAWPGIPFIYYGDEIGMRQQSSDNPIHEGHYPTRNGARTPMHWNATANCGFSECHPASLYLPVDPTPREATVVAQETSSDSLLNRVRHLNLIHREQAAFAADAAIEILQDGAPHHPLAFIRSTSDQAILCIFAPAAEPFSFHFDHSGEWHRLAGQGVSITTTAGHATASGTGDSWAFFKRVQSSA